MHMTISNGFDLSLQTFPFLEQENLEILFEKSIKIDKNIGIHPPKMSKIRVLPQICEFYFLKSNIKSKNLS